MSDGSDADRAKGEGEGEGSDSEAAGPLAGAEGGSAGGEEAPGAGAGHDVGHGHGHGHGHGQETGHGQEAGHGHDAGQDAGHAHGHDAAEGQASEAGGEDPAALVARTRSRRVKLLAYAAFCLSVSAVLLYLSQRWQPVGEVRGEVIGEVLKVSLVDAKRHVYTEGTIEGQRYRVDVSPFAREARVHLVGPNNTAVRSEHLDAKPGVTEIPTYALWSSPIDVAQKDGVIRFDWSPIPKGPGYPSTDPRYSILLAFRQSNGEMADVSLLAMEPKRTITVVDLWDSLRDHDATTLDVTLELRAYGNGSHDGALWIGGVREWTLPPKPDLPPAQVVPASGGDRPGRGRVPPRGAGGGK